MGMSRQQIDWCLGGQSVHLSQPVVMGILNVTPDSFSDGGRHASVAQALARAVQMQAEGARIVDIGGESTRPGAAPVPEDEELARVLPVVQALAQQWAGQGDAPLLSIDTSSPRVFAACWAVTPCIWNDVRALKRPGARQLAAALDCPVVLMHSRAEPDTMQAQAVYTDVASEVALELADQVAQACAVGVRPAQIVLDPGFGFAKNSTHNLQLLGQLAGLQALGHGLLVGISRKRVLGEVLGGAPAEARVAAGLAAAVLAVEQGALIVRTHDVRPTVDALALWAAVRAS